MKASHGLVARQRNYPLHRHDLTSCSLECREVNGGAVYEPSVLQPYPT